MPRFGICPDAFGQEKFWFWICVCISISVAPGTYSNADYTTPDMGERYYPSRDLFNRVLAYEARDPNGLNGFLLLLHIGTHPSRTDKLYHHLPELIDTLRARGYTFAALPGLE